MRVRSVLKLSIFLLIVAAFQSCKAPNSPTPPAPTLTLILPDSAHAFDTLTLRVHYSDSIKPTWVFAWQFGDSAKASTRDTFVSHIYDSAGTYTVQVTLTDTAAHQTIAKQSGQIKVMPFNGPTLTLTVPDTNYWGDSCVMSVSSSQPLKAGWKFSWSLGDSTTVTATDSVLHYYLTPGIYKVIVNLNDTVRHILLASRSATVQVVARHFDLALLQSMRYVDVTWNARVTGAPPNSDQFLGIKTITWFQNSFSMDSSYSYYVADSIAGRTNTGSFDSFRSGSVDSALTQLWGFSAKDTTSSGGDYYHWQLPFYNNSNQYFSIDDVPFRTQSDSDVIFEANGNLIKNASCGNSFSSMDFNGVKSSGEGQADWTDLSVKPYVIIRFHK